MSNGSSSSSLAFDHQKKKFVSQLKFVFTFSSADPAKTFDPDNPTARVLETLEPV